MFMLALFAIWLILFITKGRFLKQPFESVVSTALERQVEVGGDFNLYLAPFDIKFMAEDMRISSPEWARAEHVFTAELVDTRIETLPMIFGRWDLDWLDLQNSRIALEWDADGTRNSWTFRDSDAPPKPLEMPDIRRGTISGTRVSYRDPPLALTAVANIETAKAADTSFDSDIRFSGGGRMHDRPFKFSGSLLSPNETIAGGRNALTAQAEAPGTRLEVSGTLPGPTQFEGADLKLGAQGVNIADLFNFLGIAVPATRAYRIDSALTYADGEWRFTGIEGMFGDSDISGSLRILMPGERLKLIAELSTDTLNIIDAAPFIGYDPERLEDPGASGAVEANGGHPRVLPDTTLRIDAISRFDADLHYRRQDAVGKLPAQKHRSDAGSRTFGSEAIAIQGRFGRGPPDRRHRYRCA